MKVKCDNCGHETTERKLKVRLEGIPDLNGRLDPGGVVPAGECPKCGALAYPVGKDNLPGSARAVIEEVLHATKHHLRVICGEGRNLTVYEGLQEVVEGMEASVDRLRGVLGRRGGKAATCSLCGNPCDARKAHLHQGRLIGDECCWDERLRASE